MSSVSEVLSKAADLLEQPGSWCQNAMAGPVFSGMYNFPWVSGMSLCLFSGLLFAGQTTSWVGLPDCGAIGKLLMDATGADGFPEGLIRWNDAPGRTQAEVVAKLREASALARDPGSAE